MLTLPQETLNGCLILIQTMSSKYQEGYKLRPLQMMILKSVATITMSDLRYLWTANPSFENDGGDILISKDFHMIHNFES